MGLTVSEFFRFRAGLAAVLEREAEARSNA